MSMQPMEEIVSSRWLSWITLERNTKRDYFTRSFFYKDMMLFFISIGGTLSNLDCLIHRTHAPKHVKETKDITINLPIENPKILKFWKFHWFNICWGTQIELVNCLLNSTDLSQIPCSHSYVLASSNSVLYSADLPYSTSESSLQQEFSNFGQIAEGKFSH